MSNRAFSETYRKAVIIDDEIDTCLLLGLALQRFGIMSLRAHTLAEGLAKAAEEQPSLIFLDNNLPDGIGVEQIEKFREKAPTSKLVMITAMSGLRERALQSGADGFVEKPLDLSKIEQILE
ncbi:response regulator [Runella sp. MFBS21]|uniref:response regulator n=1 Tax=Runella sp. MFBS21 TaxID=3034018 RepID=UPI0023F63321|nr:response regulator [Runella sp. MFBS21]MDF7816186.1 response regulator [Runella sp. MFBS21]